VSFGHNRAAVRSDDIERELAALQQEITAVQATLQEQESAITALEAQVAQRRERLTLTRRAVADHEARIEQKRNELDEAMAEDARERYENIVLEREAAAASFAEAAELLLERLAALDRSNDAARVAWANAQRAGAAGRPWETAIPRELEADPEVMREPWERLCRQVRDRIDEQFDDELVEAASRSSLGSAIDDLPLHLREVARQRRRARIRGNRETA
jgi:chromosome segregation ATPase